MIDTYETTLRDAGLRVTTGRLALLAALDEFPHSDAETLHGVLAQRSVATSIQSVHNMLGALASAGVLRRIERAGTSVRFDRRAGDNHHHLVCTSCGDMVDVDCLSGSAPCLHPADAAGFTVESADVTFWGTCASCRIPSSSATGRETHSQRRDMSDNYTTSQTGSAVPSDAHSLTAGADGVTALHDRYLLEKLAQFNRERIPERIVHAKGGGAFGELVVTGDVSAYTKAALFQPGARTESISRFSSVAGEQGSPDTWRDVRGFSVKFYTTEGNYDIVGNNTPVFFIRDGIKFPDFIHSQKRLPGSGLRDADMQWDFWTLSPESAHQVTYLMGDRGLPRSWRTMPGFGSHTYQWINAAGERFWVKYHFTSNQGNVEMEGAEAEIIAGADADYYRRDLYEAIEREEFPSWDLHVQVMPYEDAKTYRFNPFDLTKVWPKADYPLIKVGTHTLNRNPENFFAEIEQAAFSPANTVPGIDISPDKMLMARVFSYPDAQRYRVGTNYNELPVNAPKAPVHNYSQDGSLRHGFKPASAPVYAPNSFGGPVADEARAGMGSWESDGELTRTAATLHAEDDDFGQAGTLYRDVFDDAAKQRFLETITGAVGGVQSPEIKERAIQYWTSVDATLGAKLRAELTKPAETPNEAAEFVGVAE